MAVTVTKIKDTAKDASILVQGSFNGANTANVFLLAANSLSFANTSEKCRLAVAGIDYHTALKSTGYIELQWEGNVSSGLDNTALMTLGGTVGAEIIRNKHTGVVIPFFNTANGANSHGNINLSTVGLANGDNFSLIIHLKKVSGYANSANGYNPTVRTP